MCTFYANKQIIIFYKNMELALEHGWYTTNLVVNKVN